MFLSTPLEHDNEKARLQAIQRSFLFVLVTAVAATATILVIYNLVVRNSVHQEIAKDMSQLLEERSSAMVNQINAWQHDVRFLRSTPPTEGLVRAFENQGIDPAGRTSYGTWLTRLSTIFDAYIASNPDIMQIRFINVANDGLEEIRVQRKNGLIRMVPSAALQNKSAEVYYQASLSLRPGESYISDITLNREYGQVEYPYVKTIRIIEPVFDSTQKVFGLVIVNYYAGHILTQLLGFKLAHKIPENPEFQA